MKKKKKKQKNKKLKNNYDIDFIEYLSYLLNITPNEAKKSISKLIDLGLLEKKDTNEFCNFKAIIPEWLRKEYEERNDKIKSK